MTIRTKILLLGHLWSRHVFVVRRLGWIFEFQTHLYIYVNNGAKIYIFPIRTNLERQKIGTLMLSGQNMTKYGSLCPDINGSLTSGYIRGT